jgi:hypothetical protein
VARLNWEKARRRELVRDRGADPIVQPVRQESTGRSRKRKRRHRGPHVRRDQVGLFPRSGWAARKHTRSWMTDEEFAITEEAMAKRVPR